MVIDLEIKLGAKLMRVLARRQCQRSRMKSHLVNIRLCASRTSDNLLDELGHLSHDVDAVPTLTHGSSKLSFDGTVCAGPFEGDGIRLGPMALRIIVRGGVLDRVCGPGTDDLVVCGNATDVDNSPAVRRGSGELHQDGAVGRRLEVGESPASSSVVGFHALQSVDEETTTSKIDGTLLGDDAALDLAPGPEGVPHLAPRGFGIGTKGAGTVLTNDKAGSGAREGQVNNGAGVGAGFDVVTLAIIGESHRAALSVEAIFSRVETIVRKGIR